MPVSKEALQIVRELDVIDLHLDTFISMRLFGWELARYHGEGLLRGRFFGHVDLPRIEEGGLTGAMWSITTNPFRSAAGRWRAFLENLSALQRAIADTGGRLRAARTLSEYRAARAGGAHASMIAVQGGNCLDAAPEGAASIPDRAITRVTLVHLLSSAIGGTSAPFHHARSQKGLTRWGRTLVEQLDAARIFVDLAHIHPDGFWDAVEVHDRSLPLIATHTGVDGVKPHWRNLDDRQLRAIAETGGTIGIIFSQNFLGTGGRAVVAHMRHVIETVGDDFVSIGSDYDGAITPPHELLAGAAAYPRLVQLMLDDRWPSGWIEKALGRNFLRAFEALRP